MAVRESRDPPAEDDPRRRRHERNKARIVEAAWKLARRDGLGGISLGDLAKAVGLRQPSLYTYFDSKLGLYDEMFADGNRQLWDEVVERDYPDDPRERLKELGRAMIAFYSSDVTRAQLLFQRPIPGFEPSREAYAPAVAFLEWSREKLAAAGIERPEHADMYTAIVAGIANSQTSNEPGGDRWLRLVDDLIDMFLDHIDKG